MLTPPALPATPARAEQHWLPVRAHVSFKVLVYVNKAINDLAPVYLSDLADALYQAPWPETAAWWAAVSKTCSGH